MQSKSVPATFDEFVTGHSKFIRYLIFKVSKGQARPDDIDDLLQQVLLRAWEKNYLDRVRVLLTERGGAFNTYVWWLVRSVCINQFRSNFREPVMAAKRALDPRERDAWVQQGRPQHTTDIERHAAVRMVDAGLEARLVSLDTLDRFSCYIASQRRGAQLASTLQRMFDGETSAEIALAEGVPLSRVSYRRKKIRTSWATFERRAS